ncbi:hypothetical protein [uncultured Duncaniella sp.]|jgi:hypothetical protein|uniref:hypothetical protein n=1 Tax=uncultured Duncaniella sp. TaxID=2768039 RepID=UPI0025B0F196|nr:hypothetical protein [uncultured Duncaniella sp.]
MPQEGKVWDFKGLLIGRCPADRDSVAVAFLICPEAECITATFSYTRYTPDIESRMTHFQQMIDRGETEEVSEISQHIYV